MTEQDKILEYKLRMNNSEIMTIEQLKEYKLLFDRINHIHRCDDIGVKLNEDMNKFIVMQEEEKIIWAFATNFKHAGSNILLTNKGKILYIERCSDYIMDLLNYELKYHNFVIPSYAICALKMLIKNIEGQYTRFATNDGPKTNNNDFKSIYKNINEYLEQLKQEQLKQEQLKQEQLNQEQLNQEQLKQEQLNELTVEQLKQLKQEQIKELMLTINQLTQEQIKEFGLL